MPKRRKDSILDYLDSYAFSIMKPLKEGEASYSDLMKKSKLVRSNFNRRLGELLRLKLVKVEYDEDKRKPFYSLTTEGRKILENMVEIERVYLESTGDCLKSKHIS